MLCYAWVYRGINSTYIYLLVLGTCSKLESTTEKIKRSGNLDYSKGELKFTVRFPNAITWRGLSTFGDWVIQIKKQRLNKPEDYCLDCLTGCVQVQEYGSKLGRSF